MKISKLEATVAVLATAVLAFSLGWFLRSSLVTRPFQVETARVLPSQEPETLPTPEPSETEKININTADAETLMGLPGIGAKKAADIVAYRTEHGPFRIPEQITDVPGIGESTMRGFLDQITVTDP